MAQVLQLTAFMPSWRSACFRDAFARYLRPLHNRGRRTSVFYVLIEGAAIIPAAVGFVLGARRPRTAVREAQDLRDQARTLSWLLKRLEHQEIAELRNVGETTVRQQARSVYRKGGLSGRHDLAAFFLEGLLAPRPASAADASSNPPRRSA